MSVMLKIKAKTLADESKHIRKAETKLLDVARRKSDEEARNRFNLLRDHRKSIVRPEARATHIARAFLNGRTYAEVEKHTRFALPPSVYDKVLYMVKKYHNTPVQDQEVADWFDGKYLLET